MTLLTRMLFRLLFNLRKKTSFIFITAVVNMNCCALTMAVGGIKYYYWTCKSMTSSVPTPVEDEPSYTDGLKDN